ncbi:hypothetical protein AWW68_02390 [Roseivirga spongicola]|uniref:Viral A-type inclusion protein n=2 Tax=Roseivirga spongicola TaxID=333140 RepID=A0A150XG15_9BACT|nr:hypothetical protein AWW68_02390 [Roseivirga spongicola]
MAKFNVMKKLSLLLFVLTLFVSCGSGFDAEAEKNKIFDIHDEVMPKMGELMSLKRKVIEKASEVNAENASELQNIAQELDEASEGMMSWMRDWSKNSQQYMEMKNGTEAQKEYLAAEMERVIDVKEAINTSMAKAKEALK